MASISKRLTTDGEARYDVRYRAGGRPVEETYKRRRDAENLTANAILPYDEIISREIDEGRAGPIHDAGVNGMFLRLSQGQGGMNEYGKG